MSSTKVILFIICFFLNLFVIQTSTIIAQSDNSSTTLKTPSKKKSRPTKWQRENWQHLDFDQDTILGVSIDKAYLYAKGLKVKDTVIVAVIDSDPDLNHEDLQRQLWINSNEIPDNNIDDDHNGYVDDIHGWNFVSSAAGKSMIFSLMEETRIIQKFKAKFTETPLKIKNKDSADYKWYVAAKASYDETMDDVKAEIKKLEQKKLKIKKYEDTLKIVLSDSVLTLSRLIEFGKVKKQDSILFDKIKYIVKQRKKDVTDSTIDATIARHLKAIEICLDLDKDNRTDIVKDNPDDIKDTNYGSPQFSSGIDHLVHSTSVSGVLAANSTNTVGIKGVAQHAKIMFLDIGTFGDYTDKDLALSIRYAVDNGASIINLSQSKRFSMHEDWVDDALEYTQKHNVLIVASAGNSNLDLDLPENLRYPNDIDAKGNEFVDNYITVGGNSYFADKNIKWSKSNYGKNNVDLFAPGRLIKVPRPYNKYKTTSGTSYAAPIIAGVAAMILSYYPELSATQLKEILLTSGISFDIDAKIKDSKETIPFSHLSKSGKIVNAYNALLMAAEMTQAKE